MSKTKTIYEYQWFKPYLVKVEGIGRRTFYKPTIQFFTKEEAARQGIFHRLNNTRRPRK